jgi:hypothetical protein
MLSQLGFEGWIGGYNELPAAGSWSASSWSDGSAFDFTNCAPRPPPPGGHGHAAPRRFPTANPCHAAPWHGPLRGALTRRPRRSGARPRAVAQGEPNGGQSGEHCLQLYPSGTWNDLSCASEQQAVCGPRGGPPAPPAPATDRYCDTAGCCTSDPSGAVCRRQQNSAQPCSPVGRPSSSRCGPPPPPRSCRRGPPKGVSYDCESLRTAIPRAATTTTVPRGPNRARRSAARAPARSPSAAAAAAARTATARTASRGPPPPPPQPPRGSLLQQFSGSLRTATGAPTIIVGSALVSRLD